jgi:GT2 family glycosyltransferase
MTVKFSVVIPVHNREKLVPATIDSVLAQTFTDYETIVVDDGSTDRTLEVLQSYGTRIKSVCQANQGPEVARSRGAALASGEYLVFLDSDDLLLPWALDTYNCVARQPVAPALILAAMFYCAEGEVLPKTPAGGGTITVRTYPDFLSKDVTVGVSCSMIIVARAAFQRAGGLRQSTPTTFHMDTYDMLLRFGTCGPCVIVKEPATVAYRTHGSNTRLDVERMVAGALAVARAERQGQYPGGGRRRLARYACIGGMAGCWSWYALKACRFGTAFKLLAASSPMVMAAVLKRLWVRCRAATPALRLNCAGTAK